MGRIVPERRPLHKIAHPVCEWAAANWGDCDKARAVVYADWQAMQQVILAYNVCMTGDTTKYRKEKSQFAGLVQYINGDVEEMLNDDGNPSVAPFVVRLRAAIERFKAGDLPAYNLYQPVVPAVTEGG
jgi:hypothetical protein